MIIFELIRILARKQPSFMKFSKFFDRNHLVLKLDKDISDKRDIKLLSAIQETKPSGQSITISFPEKFDLKAYCTPIKNQLNIGSCTAFSILGAYEIFRKRDFKENVDTSELFTYYNARLYQGWENDDRGAYLRDACKSALNDGICLEEVYPYIISKYRDKPYMLAYISARFLRLKGFYRCSTIDEIKQALIHGWVVVFGMRVYSNYLYYRGGVYKSIQGSLKGGHAQAIIGWDDKKNAFLVRNSWSTSWGEDGYAWIDYDLLKQNLQDAWALEFRRPK